jgi:catechol 2,3-dioxygenase-like lactoylglutathione lyase family enzyme
MKRLAFASVILACCVLSLAADQRERPRIYILASVRFRVSDLQKSRAFYQKTFQIGAVRQDCFGANTLCLDINEAQRIELIQGDTSSKTNSVEQVGFRTYDLDGLRRYLIHGGAKPGAITKDKDGKRSFDVLDPEGHRVVFLSVPLPGSFASWPGQVGGEIIHAGFVVHDRAAEDHFYKDILGFHVYWHGGRKDDETSWVDMQVPDGTDWIEYMLNVPANADHHTLGVMNHIALGVPDIHAAEAQLRKNGWTGSEQPKIGRDGKWQLNLYDPDDTRVELMEFTPTQKPCCADYTGPHPGPKQ